MTDGEKFARKNILPICISLLFEKGNTMNKYVISIQQVKDIFGKELDTPEWKYAAYDNFSGCMSSGYPIFADIGHAIFFATCKEAEEWFNRNYQYMDRSYHDKSTLAIRKIVFKTAKKIKL